MAFLNGQEAPTVETSDADFNMLGIRMRGYHDFPPTASTCRTLRRTTKNARHCRRALQVTWLFGVDHAAMVA